MKIEADDSVAALCIVALVLATLITSVAVCDAYENYGMLRLHASTEAALFLARRKGELR